MNSSAQVIGEAEGEVGPGPVKALLDKETFQEIHLLSNYDPTVTKQYVAWLKQRAVRHQVKFKNPSDHGEILAAVQPVLESLDVKKDDELCFHLSPGTPAMASIWILLGKSQYPATRFQTHWDKVWTTEIPFDITTDLLPKILRDPDRFWQHLATRSPQEVRGFEGILGQSRAIRLAVGRAQRAAIHDVPAKGDSQVYEGTARFLWLRGEDWRGGHIGRGSPSDWREWGPSPGGVARCCACWITTLSRQKDCWQKRGRDWGNRHLNAVLIFLPQFFCPLELPAFCPGSRNAQPVCIDGPGRCDVRPRIGSGRLSSNGVRHGLASGRKDVFRFAGRLFRSQCQAHLAERHVFRHGMIAGAVSAENQP